MKGKRDRAILAVLAVDDLQQRDGDGAIADLRGKHGRVRTVVAVAA